jgi:hypothetical protein
MKSAYFCYGKSACTVCKPFLPFKNWLSLSYGQYSSPFILFYSNLYFHKKKYITYIGKKIGGAGKIEDDTKLGENRCKNRVLRSKDFATTWIEIGIRA